MQPLQWKTMFQQWFEPFQQALKRKAQQKWATVYLQGLCSNAHRKSMQPIAEEVAPGKHDRVQHFITDSPWETAPLEVVLARKADALLGGPDACLIIDDTCLSKFGKHSVGVTRQYSGQEGKITNCQSLVSLTLACNDVPVPVALRLFLPKEWTDDPDRCNRAGIPEDQQRYRPKWQMALAELDQVRKNVTFGVVLADAGYGMNAEFRQGLSQRCLVWSVGILRTQKVYSTDVRLSPYEVKRNGRPPKRLPIPSEQRETVEAVLDRVEWETITWRVGTKGPLTAKFAVAHVRTADGAMLRNGQHLPGEEVWIIGEERKPGERKYYASNLPASTPKGQLVEITKRRWSCELMHRDAKEELGLDHFEGRSWRGLHHHALLCMIALNFLQWLRRQGSECADAATVPAVRLLLSRVFSGCGGCAACPLGPLFSQGP
ncbi:IS701 family transposase [Deinococcus peraridilitoris]|uniref:Transposase family protein n=1 Tax=Deinococcus peraridilitoris (strain DSM 19664 / LMG 22246 / CIP 109416 / KR-200) TaxID=937777 RepID=L0A887_DEIPD|nr:IS701 family transposase [Deinococcus peraridilitoris]AFZ69397.1 transposase family protein [Deinococcus peraridilitoris DSM 19664]